MEVKTFEEKYKALQNEGKEIYAEIKPLLARLKRLSRRCSALLINSELDKELYVNENGKGPLLVEEWEPNGWNHKVLDRLIDMEFVLDYSINISDALYKLDNCHFMNRQKKCKKTNANH